MPSLSDWKPFSYDLPETSLWISIHDDHVEVSSSIEVKLKPDAEPEPLFLNGSNLELVQLRINGDDLDNNEYQVSEDGLTIHDVPDEFLLEVTQKFVIDEYAVDGLYASGETLVTQCEDEGFRKIAFFPDRPDVLSQFLVTLEADKDKYPDLLSNGNVEDREDDLEGNNRHTVTFDDPFPKPCYLFAMVAGNLKSLESLFYTRERHEVVLTIYSDEKSIRHCKWAMKCLKEAMKWDEDAHDRVYDLARFSIIAVEKFVFGAMENKSLNVFNNSVLLASPDVATDETYERIQSVVGHEYFHNYSGNRVTVRDWFQLSLKEGFTVLRDQSFSRDLIGFDICRVLDAEHLRRDQFPEAQSGLSHPVRPTEMTVPANYYTRTIYEGGAEVAYMLSNLVGKEAWKKATNHYFEKFDGQAVTIEDFVEAVAESTEYDLSQFKLWYSTSGTPGVHIREHRHNGTVRLIISQRVLPTADQPEKPTLAVPLGLGIVDIEGQDLLGKGGNEDQSVEIQTEVNHSDVRDSGTCVFDLQDTESEIVFTNVPENSEISVLRDFSAPVEVSYFKNLEKRRPVDRLRHLALLDTNAFARFDAVQQLFIGAVLNSSGYDQALLDVFTERLDRLTDNDFNDPSAARLNSIELSIPREGRVLDLNKGLLVEDISSGLNRLEVLLGDTFARQWQSIVAKYQVPDPYEPSPSQIAARCIRRISFGYLLAHKNHIDPNGFATELANLFRSADNLTDRLAFFKLLLRVDENDQLKEEVAQQFFAKYQDNSLIVERWMSAQVMNQEGDPVKAIEKFESAGLLEKPTPNRWRAAYSAYTDNWTHFHKADGSGYKYYTQRLITDAETQPSLVRRGVQALAYWHRHDADRSEKMRACLEQLSREVPADHIPTHDMIERGLRSAPD